MGWEKIAPQHHLFAMVPWVLARGVRLDLSTTVEAVLMTGITNRPLIFSTPPCCA